MKFTSWTLPFRFRRPESVRGLRPDRATELLRHSFRPVLEKLEERLAPALTAAGAGAGSPPLVTVLDQTGAVVTSFNAYDSGFTGGVNVALADVTGDGKADIITGAGAGGGPQVKVFDGNTGSLISSFFAFDAGFTGGVNVATGDVNGNGAQDVITGAGAGGGPEVRAWSIAAFPTLLADFMALPSTDTGGVRVGSIARTTSAGDDILATKESAAGPVNQYELAGTTIATFNLSAAAGAGGFSLSSNPVGRRFGGGTGPNPWELMPQATRSTRASAHFG